MTIEEKRNLTSDFIDWHVKRGFVSEPDPVHVAEIVECEKATDGHISHKSAVMLLHFYMIEAWYQKHNLTLQ